MSTSSSEVSQTAQHLYDLHEDLDRFSSVPILVGKPEHYEAMWSASPAKTNYRFANLIHNTFTGADKVIIHPIQTDATPNHQLTVSAVRAARGGQAPDFHKHYQDLCLAAELKVEHSIRLNQAGGESRHGVAAAILFDKDREPFAYSKFVGKPVALAWREAVMDTASGDKIIPAGSFFGFEYAEHGKEDIRSKMSRLGHYLISLENLGPLIDVRLFRFSTFLLSKELAESAYQNATGPDGYNRLKKYVPTVLDLGLDGIAAQVQTLLHNGRAHKVEIPT
jgi:hypothetical protein